MELVSNVQTSIKSLCHKGPGRWREVTALPTPARPGKEFTSSPGRADSSYNDLPEFSLPGQLLGACSFPRERFQLIFQSKFHFPTPRILNQFYRLSKDSLKIESITGLHLTRLRFGNGVPKRIDKRLHVIHMESR